MRDHLAPKVLIVGVIALVVAACSTEPAGVGTNTVPYAPADAASSDATSCQPKCSGKECGPDGCGAVCGKCPSAAPLCGADGQCKVDCQPTCSGKECGPDGCGSVCGQCPSAAPLCSAEGQCKVDCQPKCSGKTCGPDGCGKLCGTCAANQQCESGTCATRPPKCAGPSCSGDTCEDNMYVKCSKDANGCLTPSPAVPCPSGQICNVLTDYKCAPCTYGFECGDAQVCQTGSCVNATGLTYRFTFYSAKVPEKDANGAAWDAGGGLPDVKACLYLNCGADGCASSALVGCTKAKADTLSPTWVDHVDTKVFASDKVGVLLFDQDFSNDDYMTGVEWKNPLSLLHSGAYNTKMPDDKYELFFTVEAK